MHFNEYQEKARRTDQMPSSEDDLKALILPLLGLAGETGSLLTHYKRFLRDGEGYNFFKQRIAEELGDILWNVANIASKTQLGLEEVAAKNLEKIQDRWTDQSDGVAGPRSLDDGYPQRERFPRKFIVDVVSEVDTRGRQRAWLSWNGSPFGDDLSDNAPADDGYRLHDVFHLSFVAVLGWSPVLRGKRFFNCKRKSDPDVDEIQDGGRATVIDEAIAALIFVEAGKNSFYKNVETVEYNVLRTIKELTAHLEVSRCTGRDWEKAILSGFRIWRALRDCPRGRIIGDLDNRSIRFEPTSAG